MKQTTNKMFGGCPYQDANFKDCSFCPNYCNCVRRRKERRREKRIRMVKRIIRMIINSIRMTIKKIQLKSQEKIQISYANLWIILFSLIAVIVVINGLDYSDVRNANVIENTKSVEQTEEAKQEITTTSPSMNEIVKPEETIEPEIPEAKLSADGPSEEYYYHISDEDKIAIAKVVWAEARGECFEGKVAVAAVVLNRYYSEIAYFDTESILAVVTQKNQFASIENVTKKNLENNPDCMQAVEDACKGWDPTRVMFETGALYFYAPEHVSGYQAEVREKICVLVIGNHNFHYDFEKVE